MEYTRLMRHGNKRTRCIFVLILNARDAGTRVFYDMDSPVEAGDCIVAVKTSALADDVLAAP